MGLNILAWVKAKKYTDNAVSQSAALHREIVNSLPITGDDKVIYMVPVTGSGDDNYNEYMWINGAYELIGNTRVDLTDYYNKTQVDAALSGKANTSDIPTTLASLSDDATHRFVTDTEKSTWNGKSNFSGSYNDLSNKPTIPTALSSLTDDSTHRVVTDKEKSTWNGKANSATTLAGYGITNAYTKTEVDTALKELIMLDAATKTIASLENGKSTTVSIDTTPRSDGYRCIGISYARALSGNNLLTIAGKMRYANKFDIYVMNNTGATRSSISVEIGTIWAPH